MPNRQLVNFWPNDDLIYIRIYVSLSPNELIQRQMPMWWKQNLQYQTNWNTSNTMTFSELSHSHSYISYFNLLHMCFTLILTTNFPLWCFLTPHQSYFLWNIFCHIYNMPLPSLLNSMPQNASKWWQGFGAMPMGGLWTHMLLSAKGIKD